MKRKPQFFLLVLGLTFFAIGMSHGGPALAQMTVSLSREQVIEQAKKEGKLLLHPFLRPNYGEKETIPQLFKAFATKYPFIQPAWGTVTQTEPSPKQSLEELVAGKAVVDGNEAGRGSFLIEGTLAHKLAKGANISLCGFNCLAREDKIVERIAVKIWGLAPPRAQE